MFLVVCSFAMNLGKFLLMGTAVIAISGMNMELVGLAARKPLESTHRCVHLFKLSWH